MADLPSANTTLSDTAGAKAAGLNYLVVLACVATGADITPRVFQNSDAIIEQHGYAQGVDYCSMHFAETKKPIIFVGLPIVTVGVIGRKNASGNTGTSVITLTEGPAGTLDETDGVLTVIAGGTIGTDQIMLGLSLDGGRTTKRVRLGTGNSYTIPHVGVVISFAAGTLVTGDTAITWHTTAPRWDQAGLAAARTALAAQQKLARKWLVIGDLTTLQDATDVYTEVSGYETSNERFTVARASLRDRLPYAEMSQVQVRMTGAPSLTFAEVGGTGDTITRATGSWVTDGFAVGQAIDVSGTASNNFTDAKITGVSATVLTLDTQDLAAEVTALATVTGSAGLTFAEVGGTGDTLTRAGGGSWLGDGFRVGDKVVITGTASNNVTATVGLTAVSATVLTFDTTDLAAEFIGSYGVSITAGETKAAHVATMDALVASIDDMPRINLSHGRGRKTSPVLGYAFRRPSAWAATVREFQHDVHIATYQKDLGPLVGWDLNDEDGNLVEHDERVDGGALAARFTCFRTWANGPGGTFIALDLTRATDNATLSRSQNMDVANVACTTVQAATEQAIGQSLILNDDGTATPESLNTISSRVNSAVEEALLQDKGEGPRASSAVWTPATDDDLSDLPATLNGVLALNLRGTIERINTVIRVQ